MFCGNTNGTDLYKKKIRLDQREAVEHYKFCFKIPRGKTGGWTDGTTNVDRWLSSANSKNEFLFNIRTSPKLENFERICIFLFCHKRPTPLAEVKYSEVS